MSELDNTPDLQEEPSRRGRKPRAEHLHESTEQSPSPERGRSPRVPFQSGGKLNVPAYLIEKGYRYYWGVDRDGQLDQLRAAWYEFVLDPNGQKVTANAGKGNVHYLMRIEEKYFNEDMEAQQRMIADLEADSAKIGHGEYSPNDGRSGVGSALRRERDIY